MLKKEKELQNVQGSYFEVLVCADSVSPLKHVDWNIPLDNVTLDFIERIILYRELDNMNRKLKES